MNVTSSQNWRDQDGNFRKVAISLGHNDFLKLVTEGKIPGAELKMVDGVADEQRLVVLVDGEEMTVSAEFRALMKAADTLLIYQMTKEGAISVEDAKRQVAEL